MMNEQDRFEDAATSQGDAGSPEGDRRRRSPAGELRTPDMAMLAGRALIDEDFRQYLKNNPEAALNACGLAADEWLVEWLKTLPWDDLRDHARAIVDDLPEAERYHYSW
jgi:hypothetical protein